MIARCTFILSPSFEISIPAGGNWIIGNQWLVGSVKKSYFMQRKSLRGYNLQCEVLEVRKEKRDENKAPIVENIGNNDFQLKRTPQKGYLERRIYEKVEGLKLCHWPTSESEYYENMSLNGNLLGVVWIGMELNTGDRNFDDPMVVQKRRYLFMVLSWHAMNQLLNCTSSIYF